MERENNIHSKGPFTHTLRVAVSSDNVVKTRSVYTSAAQQRAATSSACVNDP